MPTYRSASSKFLVIILIALAAWRTGGVNAASAQSYPSQIIRVVVASAAGTPPDLITRIVANELAGREGWKIVIENRTGASQTLGAADVLKSPADGHTIVAFSLPITAASALVANMRFDLLTDFTPVAMLSRSYNVLVVTPASPARSMGELVALLKEKPDTLTFSSGGFGSPAHLVGELFKREARVKAAHVPYRQFPQAIGDLLNGTNHYMFITTLPVLDLIETGSLRALAVTAPRRIQALPDVPSVNEQGYPGLIIEDWVGLAVRAGTAGDTVSRLNGSIEEALRRPAVREAMRKLGSEPAGGPASEFRAFLRDEVDRWTKVVNDADIRIGQP